MKPRSFAGLLAIGLVLALASLRSAGAKGVPAESWEGIWATAPIEEDASATLKAGPGSVLRQVLRLSRGASVLRLRLSNEYGWEPLVLDEVRIAASAGAGAVVPGSDRPLTFRGSAQAVVAPGAFLISDPVAFKAPPLADIAVTVRIRSLPARIAAHPGSRTTSYLCPGGRADAEQLTAPSTVVHWYFMDSVDGLVPPGGGAVVCFGDSFTDGYGCKPDQNTRWTDALARRLQADPALADLAVLNAGIGGNRLLRPGLGPTGLARLSRDVLERPGVRWVVVQLGVNDLGTRLKARQAGQAFASAADIIAGYKQVIAACHARGLRVALATLTPFSNAAWYCTPDIEADRRTINAWIRGGARCEAIVDFDEALKDPSDPTRLLAALDSGDHLHPSMEGYRLMASLVPREFLSARQPLAP